jgi:hypothetical protein
MHVAHVILDLQGGGMESLVATMGARFAGTDVSMSVLTLSGRVGHVGSGALRHFHSFRVVRPQSGISMLRPSAVARALREMRPDVVHVHSGCWYKGVAAARFAGIPRVVYTEHGREHKETRLGLWLARRATPTSW